MMEGFIKDQGWFLMGKILKPMYRVKRSAEKWYIPMFYILSEEMHRMQLNVPSRAAKKKNVVAIKKELGTGLTFQPCIR
jgi:hypothetical protein